MNKFKCPNCGFDQLEEVVQTDEAVNPVIGVDADGYLEYGGARITGEIYDTYFRCALCGKGSYSLEQVINMMEGLDNGTSN